MLHITYISSAAPDITETAVQKLLLNARRNNGRLGLTGMLLYDGQRFLQHLEGDAANVELVYGRIKADPRHRGLVELSRRDAPARQFPKTWMAYGPGRIGLSEEAPLFSQVAMLVANCNRETAAHFLSFAKLGQAA